MHACIHTYIPTYIHTYIHTYMHACIHTYTSNNLHLDKHTGCCRHWSTLAHRSGHHGSLNKCHDGPQSIRLIKGIIWHYSIIVGIAAVALGIRQTWVGSLTSPFPPPNTLKSRGGGVGHGSTERGHPEPFGLTKSWMLLRSWLAIQFRSVFLVFPCFYPKPLDPQTLRTPCTLLHFSFFSFFCPAWTLPRQPSISWTSLPPLKSWIC